MTINNKVITLDEIEPGKHGYNVYVKVNINN